MSRTRTFVAVDLDAAVRRQAKSVIQQLSDAATGVTWVAPDKLHLTLKFLGDVDETEIYRTCLAVQQVARTHLPFRLFCQGVGAFPSLQRPRTIWLGIEDRQDQVLALQADLEQALGQLGFPREQRPFRPHVTIGRVSQRARRLSRLLERLADHQATELGTVSVDECVVYGSERTPIGPHYTPLGRAPLGE